MSTTTPERVLDAVEAEARRTMARVAQLPRRGWDSERKRAAELASLDALLDQWNGLRG